MGTSTHEGVRFLTILRKPRSSKACSGAEEPGACVGFCVADAHLPFRGAAPSPFCRHHSTRRESRVLAVEMLLAAPAIATACRDVHPDYTFLLGEKHNSTIYTRTYIFFLFSPKSLQVLGFFASRKESNIYAPRMYPSEQSTLYLQTPVLELTSLAYAV